MPTRFYGIILSCILFSAGLGLGGLSPVIGWIGRGNFPRLPDESSSTFSFLEVSEEFGVSFFHQPPRLDPELHPEEFHLIGGGIAVADVTGNGYMDFYVVGGKVGASNHLYINQGGEGFIESAYDWGVAEINVRNFRGRPFSSLGPVFFDYNNDGRPDLFIAGAGCSRLFENKGDHFKEVSLTSGVSDCRNSQYAVPFDFTGNGYLDLYVLRYFGEHNLFRLDGTSSVYVNSIVDATNGGTNTLYANRGDGTFLDVSESLGGKDYRWSFDAAVGDITGQGGFEMLISNDFGADTLYRLTPGGLENISYLFGTPGRRLGMGVSLGFIDDSGLPHVHVSNAYHELYRNEGNYLWKFRRNLKGMSERARVLGTENCKWAWGSVFGDFNQDGSQELYVTNGFLSPENKDNSRDLSFTLGTYQSIPSLLTNDVALFSSFINRGEKEKAFAGNQKDCLFAGSDSSFVNVASSINSIKEWDGRAVASIDINNNGLLDLIVTTRNKGVKILKNNLPASGRWIGLRLLTGKGGRDVAGAKVRLVQRGEVQYRQSTAGKSGFMAVSDPRVHFGLKYDEPVQLQVTWPDGSTTRIEDFENGLYHTLYQN